MSSQGSIFSINGKDNKMTVLTTSTAVNMSVPNSGQSGEMKISTRLSKL